MQQRLSIFMLLMSISSSQYTKGGKQIVLIWQTERSDEE